MTSERKRWIPSMAIAALALLFQYVTQAQEPPPPPPPPQESPSRPVQGQASSQAEFEAYKAVESQADPAIRAELGRQFLTQYPDSGLQANVYRQLIFAYQQLNDAAQCIEAGERYLSIMPQDVEILSILAFVYGEIRRHQEAAARATAANELLKTFTPPPTVTAEQWDAARANLRSMNYSTLGYSHLLRGRALKDEGERKTAFELSLANFSRALELNPRDDYSYFRMGTAYALLDKAGEALNNFAKAAAIGGLAGQAAREELERLYRLTHNDSLDGLEGVMKKATEELLKGQPPGQ